MNEPGIDPQIPSGPVESQDTVESLRRQMNLLFGALIVTSFTLTVYLALQARRASMDLLVIEPRAAEAMKASQQDAASMQAVFVKLSDFARTHPDFQKQIFSKYKFNTNAVTPPAKK